MFSVENWQVRPQKLVVAGQTWKLKRGAGLFVKFVITEISAETDDK